MAYQFTFEPIAANWPLLVQGAALTLALTAVSATVGLAVGILGAVSREWRLPFLHSFFTAYVECVRVEALPKGQWEASACLAMNRYEQLRHVILPQALRIAIPPTVGFSVQVVKGTAVASIIGLVEITKTGTMIANATFRPLLVYGLVAAGYFLMCYPLSAFARRIERRLHVAGRR